METFLTGSFDSYLWVFKQVHKDTKETQEVPGVEKEFDQDAVSRLFSSTYAMRTLLTCSIVRSPS